MKKVKFEEWRPNMPDDWEWRKFTLEDLKQGRPGQTIDLPGKVQKNVARLKSVVLLTESGERVWWEPINEADDL